MWISNWIARAAWEPLADPEDLKVKGIDLEQPNTEDPMISSEQVVSIATETKQLVNLFFKSSTTPIEKLPGYVAPEGAAAAHPEEPPEQDSSLLGRCLSSQLEGLPPDLLGKFLVKQLEGAVPAIKNLVETKAISALVPGKESDLSELLRENRKSQRKIQQGTLSVDPPKEIPADRIKAITEQFTKLKELSVQMGLTWLIFGTKGLAETFHEIVTLKENIGSTNLDHGPDQIFKTALTRKFYEGKRSFREQLCFSFYLSLSHFLKFYAEYALDQFRDDLLLFLKKDSDERLDYLLPLVTKPLKSHLTAFQSYLETLNKSDNLPKSIDEIVEEGFKIDRAKSQRLINDLASVFIEKYIRSLSFTGDSLSQYAPSLENTRFKEYIPSIKASFQTCLSLVVVIPLWIANQLVRALIQWGLARFALPKFFQSTQTALSSRSAYQHTLNQFVLKKLNSFNEAAGTPKPLTLQKKSVSHQKELEELISLFYTSIPLQQAIPNISDLHEFFDPSFPLNVNKKIESFCARQIAPTAATEILTLLEESLQEEKLSGFIWEALDNLTNTLQNPPNPPSKEEKKRTEALVLDTLKSAATLAVEDTVKTFLDSSEKLNHQINAGIKNLQRFALEFADSCKDINSETFPVHNQKWETLSDMVTSLGAQMDQTKIKSLLVLGNNITSSYLKATAQFKNHVKTPQQLQKDKASLEEKREFLENKKRYFSEELSASEPAHILYSLQNLQLDPRFESNLILAKETFLRITENYLKIEPNQQSTRIFEQNFAIFKEALEKAITHFDTLIKIKSTELNTNTNGLKQEAAALKTWAENLQTVAVTSEEVKSPLFQILTPSANLKLQDVIVAKIMEYGSAALDMKSKPYHNEQLLWRFTEAYLNMPVKA